MIKTAPPPAGPAAPSPEPQTEMESLGAKLRRQRRRLGFTLDELAGRTGISKPYLSLIETGRVPNPPSDEKLRKLEQALGFTPGELLSQAHLQRTPRDVRAVLQKLLKQNKAAQDKAAATSDASTSGGAAGGDAGPKTELKAGSFNLDDAYLSGVLQEMVGRSTVGSTNNNGGGTSSAGGGGLLSDRAASNAVPVINRISAGYPKDFTDLSYPPRVADDYIGCPDVHDPDAFAARVHGDSMTPKYREGDIVIFSPAAAARDGDDCFVRFADGQTTFKRVFFESGEGGRAVVRLQPRNEKYRPQVVPSEQVAGLFRAIYRYQRVDQD